MLNDIIKIAIGFVFTGILGATISSKIQRKNFVNQTKISKTEKEVEKIKELAKKIEILSGARNYSVRVLSSAINLRGKDSEKLDEIRKEYRETVKEWNVNITTIYTELYSYNLYIQVYFIRRTIPCNQIQNSAPQPCGISFTAIRFISRIIHTPSP